MVWSLSWQIDPDDATPDWSHNEFSSARFKRVDMGIELPNGEKIVHDRVRGQALDKPFPDAQQVLPSQAHVSHV